MNPNQIHQASSKELQFYTYASIIQGLSPSLKLSLLSKQRISTDSLIWSGGFDRLEERTSFLLVNLLYYDMKFQWYTPDSVLRRLEKMADFLGDPECADSSNLVAIGYYLIERLKSSTKWKSVPLVGSLFGPSSQGVDEKSAFKKAEKSLKNLVNSRKLEKKQIKKQTDEMLKSKPKKGVKILPIHFRPLNVTEYKFQEEK